MYNNYGSFIYALDINTDEKVEDENNINSNNNYILYFNIINEDINIKNQINYYIFNNINIDYKNFQWKTYLDINTDINADTKEKAWYHWINYGKKEERAFSYINNSNIHNGRFGNIFFINLFLHFMSKKYDLKCSYKYEELFNNLGISFYKGNKIYSKNLLVTDKNFLYILKNNLNPCNIIITNNVWFQSKNFCKILHKYYNRIHKRERIIKKNLYNIRYNNNNDLFIHIRIGDVKNNYYENMDNIYKRYKNAIDKINFDKGYITSDTINDPLCIKLIQTYSLIPVIKSEIKTIMFGSTCNNIILSGGSFSWLIGFFAFFSKNVYYLHTENKWYGDIFNNKYWIKI
jgi:hypothetical protein